MTDTPFKAIHLKCERSEDGKLKGLSYDKVAGLYVSGWWNLTDKEAEALVDGCVYLHSIGVPQAEIGGRVLSFTKSQISTRGNDARIVFTFEYSQPCRSQPWRGYGALDRKIWNSGLITASLPHEVIAPERDPAP